MLKKLVVALGAILAVLGSGCVIHVTHYTDSSGNTVYVGELYSEGNSYGQSAQIQGTFFDAAGNVITTKAGGTCLGVDPHRVVPFSITLPPGTAAPAKADFKVMSTPVANAFLATGLTAEVTSEIPFNLPTDPNSTEISGLIHNNSANNYVTASVCGAWYNAAGDVVRVESADSGLLSLPPGGSAPFALSEQVPAGSTLTMFLDAGVGTPEHPLPTVIDLTSSFLHVGTTNAGRVFYFGSGDIHNSGSVAIAAPALSVVSHDPNGHLVVGSSLEACPLDIPPGGTSFATYGIIGGAAGVDAPDVTVQSVALTQSTGAALSTSAVTLGAVASNSATVSGTVKNTGTAPTFHVGVCAGVYDASGDVVGADFVTPTIPASGLAPGASASFTVKIHALFGVPTSAKALAEGFAK